MESPWRDLGRVLRNAIRRRPKLRPRFVQITMHIDGKLVHERSFWIDPAPVRKVRL